MAARIAASGKVTQLDRPAEPDEMVTEEDVQDASKLARLLMRILKALALIQRRFFPRRLTFTNRTVAAGDTLRLSHRFGVEVEYWVVKWRPASPTDSPVFDYSTDSDADTLVLDVGNAGTVSIRIESGG